jgi:amino acid adenylation domain-containing protein
MAYLLHHLLSDSAERYPDRTAVACEGEAMTYAELDRESSLLASGLAAVGIEKGARIGIYMDRSLASIVCIFGVLKRGAAYVPIDPACPAKRLNYIAAKCRLACLLTMRNKLATLARACTDGPAVPHVVVMDGDPSTGDTIPGATLTDWHAARTDARPELRHTTGVDLDLAYILFTSGSTGSPKGVMLSHLNALTFVNTAHAFFQIGSSDRLSNVCPLHFDMSVFDLFVAIKAGAGVVIIPEHVAMFPVRLAETIAEQKITVWNSVPSVLSLLATYKNLILHDLASLRLVLFAGEVLPLKHLRRLQEAIPAARFCNMYGQTEANSSTYFWVDTAVTTTEGTLPIGRPLPNFDVFALDDDGRCVNEPGIEGELYVSGSTIAMGYWENADETRRAFVRHPLDPTSNARVYKTGDLVQLNAEGQYTFAGRKDQMIKSRGYRIEIGEVEAVLSVHPGIQHAVVLAIPDERLGNRISAVVVPAESDRLNIRDVLRHCLAQLPRYMVPETVELRDSLPLTPSGKVDRKKLSAEAVLRGTAAVRRELVE